MSRAIGLILTITGAVLIIWFAERIISPEPAAAPVFLVGAIGLAMVSVGLRYLFKSKKTS